MRIIPAIDLIDGRCVRLEKGDYAKKTVYHEDPLNVAREFEAHGLTHLHLVDLDGAKAGKLVNWRVLERLSTHTGLVIDFGGGIKTDEDLRLAFASGAQQVNIGSLAVHQRGRLLGWLDAHGPERFILSADVKAGNIAIHGWQTRTDIGLMDFIQDYAAAGICTVTCTDVAKDGMLEGPSAALYQQVIQRFPDIQLIASGGVTSVEDLHHLRELGAFGAIVGKAIYEGRLSLETLSSFHSSN